MAWDKWRVSKVKDSEPEEFILTFLDTALEHAKRLVIATSREALEAMRVR